MAYDQVDLDPQFACLGRLYFQIPGKIVHGQYWLNVKFALSVVRVPFRVFAEDEEKLLSKNVKSIKKQIDEPSSPRVDKSDRPSPDGRYREPAIR